MPRLIACGSRSDAYDSFCTAIRQAGANDFCVLLVDSEGPLTGRSPWTHLHTQDQWAKPAGVDDEHAQLMVQCMEAWFLADRESLAQFFGQDFRLNALPGRTDVENVAKADLYVAIKNATRQAAPKGPYEKGRHAFELLARIDPKKVQDASPQARRLVETLKLRG